MRRAWVLGVFENGACSTPRCTSEVGDNEKNLLLVLGIGDRTHTEREETLRDEVAVLREFAADSWVMNFGLTESFGAGVAVLARWRVAIGSEPLGVLPKSCKLSCRVLVASIAVTCTRCFETVKVVEVIIERARGTRCAGFDCWGSRDCHEAVGDGKDEVFLALRVE